MLFLKSILPNISMKQQEVFKKIGGIVTEINDQYQYLLTAGDIYNDLELELLLANANFLADHIEILRKVNAAAAKAAAEAPLVVLPPSPLPAPVVVEKPIAEPHFFAPVPAEEPETEPSGTPVFEFAIENKISVEPEPTPEPDPIRHELTLEDIGEDWDEEDDATETSPAPVARRAEPKPTAPEPIIALEVKPAPPLPEPVKPEPVAAPVVFKPEPVIPTAAHTRIIAEEEQVLTFNQRMSAQMATPRMSDSFSGQGITDLKSAISLNDKLLYIKDLFNGYSLAYSEAIDILNRYKTFEEAENFLKSSYATKNNWADKQATADKFYALLQRRYL